MRDVLLAYLVVAALAVAGFVMAFSPLVIRQAAAGPFTAYCQVSGQKC